MVEQREGAGGKGVHAVGGAAGGECLYACPEAALQPLGAWANTWCRGAQAWLHSMPRCGLAFPLQVREFAKPPSKPFFWGALSVVPSLAQTKWPSMLFVLSDVAPPAFSFGAWQAVCWGSGDAG